MMKFLPSILFLGFVCMRLLSHAADPDHTFKHYDIEQFLQTKSYTGAAYSSDEKKIFLSSDETGVFNIFSIDLNTGEHTQLTRSDNQAIFLLSAFPNDDRLLYTSDESGNECNHLYLRELDGSVQDLTPYAGVKASFLGWSKDKQSFFFTSNLRDRKFMDLYEMDLATFTAKLIHKNENGYDYGKVSPDKHYLTLNKRVTSDRTELYLFDLSTNSQKILFSHQEPVQDVFAAFSKDSKYIYYTTDKNSEFSYLNRYQIESGNVETVERYPWSIYSFGFSETGRYRVTSINEDGATVVKIYNEGSKAPLNLIGFPEGDIVHVSLAKSEKSMLIYVNGDRTSTDLYLYKFDDGTYTKLTHSLSDEINADHLVESTVIRYPSYDGTQIPALFYKPKGIQEGQQIPALIWVHGGPGGQSRKGYNYLIQYLVNQGYAILAVNNRGSSGYGKSFFKAADLKHGEADLDDCMWAKRFLISEGSIDKEKIGILGGSYGGYMALAALAFRPEEMAVGVDFFGVSNWVQTLKNTPAWWESVREILYKKIGNPDTQTAYLESISPYFHAKNIRKPLLVLQGANDPRVLKSESDQIIQAVSGNGIPYRYLVFDDEGHGFVKKSNRVIAGKATLDFLNQHLKK